MSDKSQPTPGIWFPVHIKDFRSETYNMSRVEKSCYFDLWALLWAAGVEGRTVSANDAEIAAELDLKPREWTAMRTKMLQRFRTDGNVLSHDRLSAELEKAKKNVAQKRIAGIKSGESRRAKAEAENANGCSTGVERLLQRQTNGEATADEPRAGGGGGHSQGFGSGDSLEDERPFRVVAGAQAK